MQIIFYQDYFEDIEISDAIKLILINKGLGIGITSDK